MEKHCKNCDHYVVCWRVKEVETGNPMIQNYAVCRCYKEAIKEEPDAKKFIEEYVKANKQ